MPQHGPHISIARESLVPRVLAITPEELDAWPEDVQLLALRLSGELFLVRYNPFIDAHVVKKNVRTRLEAARPLLEEHYYTTLQGSIDAFWQQHDEDRAFRSEAIRRLKDILPLTSIVTSPNALIENSTDATDLRMELPMVVLNPETTEQVQAIVRLAGELGFHLIPRGGGTGLTGGAIPSMRRTAVLSLTKFKKIIEIDTDKQLLTAEAGVITIHATNAVKEAGLLFTVDPASKWGSSIGGNISENSGGPFAFEYGTTIDNIAHFKMVTPDGELITVARTNYPGHKIMPGETAIFEVRDEDGRLRETIELPGEEIRGPGLGKDVSNKALGGLPGVQKEGVDGIIVEGTFHLHPAPSLSRVLCLEFFGTSMHNAMQVIKQIVDLRDTIRAEGDAVKISALEEFNIKYVQAIGYTAKSRQYFGDPISVLIIQLDSDDEAALEKAAADITAIATPYDKVDIFTAADDREAHDFWEDRHKLSAISKRTSGFKINEDIVIPIDVIPEFADFLEGLNLHFLALAYKEALDRVERLSGVNPADEFIEMERSVAVRALEGKLAEGELDEARLEKQVFYFFKDLESRYPTLKEKLRSEYEVLKATRIIVASHMHAGDGNCHVNIPVNSGDPHMMQLGHKCAEMVFEKVQELNGVVSGEHGIGITKIGFLEQDKIDALRAYKEKVDPKNLINPGKLTNRTLPAIPYTFSFNRLINDLNRTALADRERFTGPLKTIQSCTRCNKCKQVCPFFFPQQDMLHHPRNKNISFGALLEALYYSQIVHGKPDPQLLGHLRSISEHCTGCGKCFEVCPVNIDSAGVARSVRSFLEEHKAGGHPIKTLALSTIAANATSVLSHVGKGLAFGSRAANTALSALPQSWRTGVQNPLFKGPGPLTDFRNLMEEVQPGKGTVLAPVRGVAASGGGRTSPDPDNTVFYFPGCGAGLFYRSIGLATLYLLYRAGQTVIIPDRAMCCGYPLMAHGMETAYQKNFLTNLDAINRMLDAASLSRVRPGTLLTSCGTCRESFQHYGIERVFGSELAHKDIGQYVIEKLDRSGWDVPESLLYHASCHPAWSGVKSTKAVELYKEHLSKLLDTRVEVSPGCCGESGLGALTSPEIYNKLRGKKQNQLTGDLGEYPADRPVLVGCPSCKVGIQRCLLEMGKAHQVLHTVEYLAELAGGPGWKRDIRKLLDGSVSQGGVRMLGASLAHQ